MEIEYANPEWLWCLILIAPLAFLRFWSTRRIGAGISGLVSPRLTSELIVGAAEWKRWVVFSLQIGALASTVIALARPQWGYEDVETVSEGRNLVIAIDTSRSMLANDLLPDRLTRAKLAAIDLVNSLPADRIGLIAFSGKAYTQAPLTVDHDAVIETIQQFDTEIIPRGGTNLTSAVKLAIDTLKKAESKNSALIIFSDGEDHEGDTGSADLEESAASVGLVTIAIGVGTDAGSIIPEPDSLGRPQPGVFVRDDEGNVVRSRLNPESLQRLSSRTGGGAFVNLGNTPTVAEAIGGAIEKIEATRDGTESSRRPIERFIWPVLAALVLLLAAFLLPGVLKFFEKIQAQAARKRHEKSFLKPGRQSAAVLPVLFLLLQTPAYSQNPEEGYRRFLDKNYERAIESFEKEISSGEASERREAWLNLGLGSAAYRNGDFGRAKEAFGKVLEKNVDDDLSARAHYNLGNSLFRSGQELLDNENNPDLPINENPNKSAVAEQWKSAIEHFENALKTSGSPDEFAKHNLSVVKKNLFYLQQEPPPPPEQEEEEEEEEEQEEEKEDEQQPEGQSQDSPPKGDQEKPDSEQQPGEDPPPPGDKGKGDDESQAPENDDENKGNQPPEYLENPEKSNEPPDGEIKANPDGSNPDSPPEPLDADAKNPETGMTPEEARQQLRNLSDEDLDVRPVQLKEVKAEKYKDW